MDRLSFVAFLVVFGVGCDDGAASSAAPPGRVVAVTASPEAPESAFCDVTPETTPALSLPPLAEGSPRPPLTGRVWLNVWATWCQPCVEELPLLARWRERLAADGTDVELAFLSADADDAAIQRFREAHSTVPSTARIASLADLAPWLTEIGLDEGATLPIHILTDAQGRVRCARTGAVRETDYPAIQHLLE